MGLLNNEIRATLAVSQQEALLGSRKALVLAGGREITVTVPAGSLAGQEIHIVEQGARHIFTLVISDTQQTAGFYTPSSAPYTIPPVLPGTKPNSLLSGTKANNLPPEIKPNNLKNSQFVGFSLHGMQTPSPTPLEPDTQPYPVSAQPSVIPYPDSVPPTAISQPGFIQPPMLSQPGFIQPPMLPYTTAQAGYSQVGQEGTGQPGGTNKAAPAKKRPIWLYTVLIFLVLFFGVASALFYLSRGPIPSQGKGQVTATAQSEATGAALAQASETSVISGAATAQINATGTAIAPYIEAYNKIVSGNPTLTDELSAPSPNKWETGATCSFQNGGYHISENRSGLFRDCFAQVPTLSDFAFQVQMNILKGDAGGIAFRANPTTGKLYLLLLNEDSSYALYYYPDGTGKTTSQLVAGDATAFIQGYNHPNLVTIVAKGNTLDLYVNKQYVTSIQDSSVSTGKIGVVANYKSASTEVIYTQARIWQL